MAKAKLQDRAPTDLRVAKEALYRQHIIDAAEVIFATEGFEQARMQNIAQAAGISLGTLYAQFTGKQELYRAVLITRDEQMLKAVQKEAESTLAGGYSLEAILDLMGVHLLFLLQHPNYLRMQLQEGLAWYHSSARPSDYERDIWDEGMQLMASVFKWGSDSKTFIAGEPEELVQLMLALQQTRLSQWIANGMQMPHEALVDVIKADFVRFFCAAGAAPTRNIS